MSKPKLTVLDSLDMAGLQLQMIRERTGTITHDDCVQVAHNWSPKRKRFDIIRACVADRRTV